MLTTQTFVVYLLHRGKCCLILIAPWEMLSYIYCTVGNVVVYLLHRGKCCRILIAPWEMLSYTYCTVGNVVVYLLHRGKCCRILIAPWEMRAVLYEASQLLTYMGQVSRSVRHTCVRRRNTNKKQDSLGEQACVKQESGYFENLDNFGNQSMLSKMLFIILRTFRVLIFLTYLVSEKCVDILAKDILW